MAQLVVAAAGAWVGGSIASGVVAFGMTGAQLGWMVGSAVGAAFGPKQKGQGPRLQDLAVTGTDYGQPIPYVVGAVRTAGQIVWASDRRETSTTTEAGKGGGSEFTNYTYDVDLLILLSENTIPGVSRVWSNGELIYDGNVKEGVWSRMTVYTGSASQLPDPTYEAAVGADDAPAYRGRGSVFIEGLQLGSSGNIPNLTFEIGVSVQAGVTTFDYTGANQYWTATSTTARVRMWGGGGAGGEVIGTTGSPGSGAGGGYVTGVVDTVVGKQYKVIVAGGGSGMTGGFGGGGAGAQSGPDNACRRSGAGGGASRLNTNDVDDDDLAIAPGGGGGESSSILGGGEAGGLTGQPGEGTAAGGGGTQSAGGAAGTPSGGGSPQSGSPGANRLGGAGAQSSSGIDSANAAGGGGGAGYYGGGGGGASSTQSGGGGGGSALVPSGGDTEAATGLYPGGQDDPYWETPIGQGDGTDGDSAGDGRVVIEALGSSSRSCTPLEDVVSALCARAGLSASDYDVTGLAGAGSPLGESEVCAFFISEIASTRTALEVLMAAYSFECTKSDKLYFRFRQSSAVDSIAFADLGAGESDQPLELTLANELEIPSQMAVTYRNIDADFQLATEYSDRLLSGQESTNVVQLPLGLNPAQARKVADVMLYDQVAGLIRTRLSLPLAYAALEPNDIVTVEDGDGRTYRLRLTSKKDAGTVFTFEAVVDEAAVTDLISTDPDSTLVDTSYPTQTAIVEYAQSEWVMLDIPMLRDADDSPGWYSAAKKTEGATGTWPGAVLYSSVDEVTSVNEATFGTACVFGTCTTTLGNWAGAEVFDETNTVTVNVGSGTLASSTRDAMFADSTVNVMLIGDEVIRFRLATLVSTGIYTLSGLLRGQRGTEWAISGHAADERAVLLNTDLRRAAIESTEMDVEQYWKAVTTGRALSSANYVAETNTGVSLMPFAPANLRRTLDESGAVVFTWDRRTRLLAENFLLGTVPLGEETEEYDVELLDIAGDVILSDTVTEAQWTPGASSGALDITLATSAWALQFVDGELYGIPEETLAGTGTRRVCRFDQTTGAILAQSEALGATVQQIAVITGSLVVMGYNYDGGGALSQATVKRILLSDLSTTATYTAPTPSNPSGVAYDGSALWMTERTSGKVRKLNATTLVSEGDWALEVGIEACFWLAGSLWIVSPTTSEVIEWDTGTQAEVGRFTVISNPFDVRVIGSRVFVQGLSQVGVYDATTGVPQQYHTISAASLAQRYMVPYGSDIAVLDAGSGGLNSKLKVLDAATGALNETIPSPYYKTLLMSGDTDGRLWVGGVPSSSSIAQASASLGEVSVEVDGATFRVYQVSATVGRGYPATLDLE